MKEDLLYLVDEFDNQIGQMPKLEAHQRGLLHRAFSIYLFNPEGKFLLQQRAMGKYHSGGKWSNSCCSHPRVGESLEEAYQRRLLQENGILAEKFYPATTIRYWAEVAPLIEHEFLHIVVAISDKQPVLDQEEGMAYDWVNWHDCIKDVKDNPFKYSNWFNIVINDSKVINLIEQTFQQSLVDYQNRQG